jgi:tetratricopeptide (TPR) repeat protein
MMKDRQENIVNGPQTNVGDVDGPVLSGQFPGSVTINYNSRSAPFRLPVQKPPRPEKFVGREKELTDLLRDLQPGRQVTICGPSGIGKTALVAEAIWRLVPNNDPPANFPDGLIFHDFYRQPQSAIALEAIARSFGEDLRPGLSVAARHALAGRQSLLILDGTEATDDLGAVLDIVGSCGVLITTHNHSDAPAEWSDLTSLPLGKAVQLLQDWGKEWAADETASNRICELLGCLPLAIFLAGRYLSQHSQLATEYLAWLEETPLEALNMGERLHKSFPLLMERSLERVSEMARSALGVTGILALEPFDSKLIQVALSMKPREANRSLGELANCGILQRPTAQYQVTHALIRTYARERLVPKRSSLSRLARYYFTFVRTQCGLGLSGYTCLDSHRAHVLTLQSACFDASEWKSVSVLAWAMRDYLDLQGYWTERASVLEKGLNAARNANDRYDEGAFLASLGLTYNKLGEYHQAKDLLEQSLFIAQETRDRDGEGGSLINIAISCNLLGEHERAIELCDQALSIAREIRDKDLESAAMSNIGIAHYYLGETRRAIEFFEKDLAIIREKENSSKEANTICSLGVAYSELGENDHAIELYEKYMTIVRETGNRQGEGNYLCNMGSVYNALGDSLKAIELHERALVIFREIGDRLGEGNAFFNMSLALNKIGEREKAIDRAKSALKIFEKIECPQAEKVRRKLAEWVEKEEQP